jgi:hypothetical protein
MVFMIKCISKDIDPGPASIGIANGVSAISFLLSIAFHFLIYPSFFIKLPVNVRILT